MKTCIWSVVDKQINEGKFSEWTFRISNYRQWKLKFEFWIKSLLWLKIFRMDYDNLKPCSYSENSDSNSFRQIYQLLIIFRLDFENLKVYQMKTRIRFLDQNFVVVERQTEHCLIGFREPKNQILILYLLSVIILYQYWILKFIKVKLKFITVVS